MPLIVRDLEPEEFALIATIDRSELIEQEYQMTDGVLHLVDHVIDVKGWDPGVTDQHEARLRGSHAAGGDVIGAWDGSNLVALASLEVRPVGGDPAVFELDMLFVSRPYRAQGIGRRLIEDLAERARRQGARTLYISATPTRNTVDAYRRVGAVLADPPDPRLLAREPEDIHLVLAL